MTKRNHQKTPKNTRSIKHRLRKSKRRTPLVKLDKFVNKKTFIRVSYLRCNIVIIHVGRYSALSNSTTSNKLQSPKNRIQAKRNEQGGLWLHVSPSVRQSVSPSFLDLKQTLHNRLFSRIVYRSSKAQTETRKKTGPASGKRKTFAGY